MWCPVCWLLRQARPRRSCRPALHRTQGHLHDRACSIEPGHKHGHVHQNMTYRTPIPALYIEQLGDRELYICTECTSATGDIIVTGTQGQDWLPVEARHQPGGASPHIAQLTGFIQVCAAAVILRPTSCTGPLQLRLWMGMKAGNQGWRRLPWQTIY